VADCCLIKLSHIHGCRFKVFTIIACPVSITPVNQIIITSIRSHSRGPLGTVLTIHSWELNAQTVQCTPTLEDHLAPLPFAPGICTRSHLLIVVISLSWYLSTWSMSIATTTDFGQFIPAAPVAFIDPPRRNLLNFTWTIVHSDRTPRTLVQSIRSSSPCGIHHTAAHTRGLSSTRLDFHGLSVVCIVGILWLPLLQLRNLCC
jgi:hypothetical protein